MSSKSESGTIEALSKTDALLKTETVLRPFDNIVMDIHGKLYAKVLSRASEGYLIRFTGFPDTFENWYDACINE